MNATHPLDHDPHPRDANSEDPPDIANWRALGTYVQLLVPDREYLPTARTMAEGLLAAVDASCSRFRPDSDLVRANHEAGNWVECSPILVAAVDAAVAAAEETHGLVDPTLGLSLQALGYDRDFDQVVAHQAGLTATAIPIPAVVDAWNAIEMDPAGRIKVPFGVALDLGATGKAFASDLIATTIATELGVDCLVCLGGDIRIGQSEPDETEDEAREWLIDVHEDADEPALETVTLWRGAMATSSTIGRKWTRAGQAMHHVLDPRTGQPIPQIWRTISVAADTCADANMATTMSLILGAAAPEWLTERAFPARLTALDGSVTYLPGWPEHPTDDQEH